MSRVVKVVTTKSPRSPKGPPSNHAKNPPELTQCLTIGDNKRVKLSSIIFKAGENLLREKITNLASGLPEEKYSISQHLHKLNNMFPETKEYESEHLKDAIKSYNTYARKKVAASEETGQGKMDSETYSMNCSDELKYVCLLSDARKSCKEYQGISGAVDKSSLEDLEEEETCFICGNPQNLISTEIGMICRECLRESGRAKKNLNVQFRIEDLQEEKRAKIQEKKQLADMEKMGINVPCEPKKNNDTPKRRFDDIGDSLPKSDSSSMRRFDDIGDNDDKIRKILVSKLKMTSKREDLELQKARLDVLIRRKKLENLCADENKI